MESKKESQILSGQTSIAGGFGGSRGSLRFLIDIPLIEQELSRRLLSPLRPEQLNALGLSETQLRLLIHSILLELTEMYE